LRFRAGDDFGVSRIVLHAVLRDAEGGEKRRLARDVTRDPAFGRALPGGARAGLWDAAALRPEPGDVVELQLEAFDNDAVSGPKSARSGIARLALPTAAAARALVEAAVESASGDLAGARERQRRLDRLRRESEGAAGDARPQALPQAGEWDVRRVLVDAPRIP